MGRLLLAAALAVAALAGCAGGGGKATSAPASKAPAPGVPTSPHGDNSIQTWGLEAPASERTAATRTVQAYLDARASRRWGRVCALLAAELRAEQGRLAGGAPCAAAMASFAERAQDSVLAEEAQIEVLSLRAGRRYAFLIYRRPDGVFAMPLSRPGGEWRLQLVAPEPLG